MRQDCHSKQSTCDSQKDRSRWQIGLWNSTDRICGVSTKARNEELVNVVRPKHQRQIRVAHDRTDHFGQQEAAEQKKSPEDKPRA